MATTTTSPAPASVRQGRTTAGRPVLADGTSTTSAEASAGTPPTRASQIRALRERIRTFAQDVRAFVRKTPRTIASLSDVRQLVRSSGFIGAHYVNADEAPSREDFLFSIRGCRRECKQCAHWLALLDANLDERSEEMRTALLQEAQELERIFNAIIHSMRLKAAKAKAE